MEEFRELQNKLSVRWNIFCTTYCNEVDPNAHFIHQAMRDACLRILYNPTDYPSALLQVAQFQRYYLETEAYMLWVEVYKPRLRESKIYPADETLMGAFTMDVAVAQKFYHIGIPVWMIRYANEVPPTVKFINNVWAISWRSQVVVADYDDGCNNRFKVIYRGRTSIASIEVIQSTGIEMYQRNRLMHVKNTETAPLQEELAELPAGSKLARMAKGTIGHPSCHGAPAPRYDPKAGPSRLPAPPKDDQRWDYPPYSSHMPPAIPWWLHAFQTIDKNPLRARNVRPTKAVGFPTPDPRIFF